MKNGNSSSILARKEVTQKVEQYLAQYCERNLKAAKDIDPIYATLWEEIGTYIAGGGKRLRPYLAYLAYRAFGGKDEKAIIAIASAWELLHTATLIHDDIIDRDLLRHHLPNIAGKYVERYGKFTEGEASHYALSAALLAGDLLISGTYDIIAQSSFPPEQKLAAQSHIHHALFEVAGGELVDVESVLYPILSSDPILIAQYKTATLSFQKPLACGATLAGADARQIELLEAIGAEMGITFQLKDDLLGVLASEDQTGKPNRSDIFEKKRTALVKFALENLDKKDIERIETLYHIDRVLTAEEAEEVVDLLVQSEAEQKVEQLIQECVTKAHKLIDQLDVSDQVRHTLVELVEHMATRSN